MKVSKDARRTAKKLFEACVADGSLNVATVKQVVKTLGEKKPRGYLSVVDAFWKLVRLEVERNTAEVTSAVALDDATRSKVSADLKSKYGDHVEIKFSENPELLGGMKIRVGSDVWDGSVKSRIERLQEAF